jgi:hypothetical protein
LSANLNERSIDAAKGLETYPPRPKDPVPRDDPLLLENGLPLLGRFVHGLSAFLVVLLLDFIGPAVFLYALWNRKPWGPKWAFFYIGLFIINGLIALLTVRDQLGLMQILVPDFVCAIFLAVIFWKRAYFART